MLLFLYMLIGYASAYKQITLSYNSSVSDYYGLIQNALTDIGINGGGELLITEGVYELSKNIRMFENTEIRGSGLNKTVLKLKDKALPWMDETEKNAGMIYSTEQNNLMIRSLTLDGNKQNQGTSAMEKYGRYGIFMDGCNNVTYDTVGVMNFQGYGFDPHGIKPSVWGKTLIIRNCVAENNDWDGYTLDQTENITMINNIARNNGRHGFNIVTGSRDVLMMNNFIQGNGFTYEGIGGGCGVAIQNNDNYGTKRVRVMNNTIIKSDRSGVCLSGVDDILVSNNTVIDSKECIDVTISSNIVLRDNKCSETNIFINIDEATKPIKQYNNTNTTIYVKPTAPSPVLSSPIPVVRPSPSPSLVQESSSMAMRVSVLSLMTIVALFFY